MAVVGPTGPQLPSWIRYSDTFKLMAGIGAGRPEITSAVGSAADDDTIYVAVGKDVKESKSALIWAIQNSGGKKICVLHVHVPAQMIPLMGTKFHVSSLKEQQVRAHRDEDRDNMLKILDQYLTLCRRTGTQAEKLFIEMDPVEKGIIELISRRKIRRLVMGAAADKYYSKKLLDLRSKKALFVHQQAPGFCHIHFICKGHLINTRSSVSDVTDTEVAPFPVQPNENTEVERQNTPVSPSVNPGNSHRPTLSNPVQDLFRRSRIRTSSIDMRDVHTINGSSFNGSEDLSIPRTTMEAESVYDVWEGLTRSRRSPASSYSTCSSTPVIHSALVPFIERDRSENGSELISHSKDEITHSSPPSVLDGSIDETLYDHVESAFAEAEKAKREAFNEAVRRGKAEKDAIDSIRRAKASEILYGEELKRRKEIQEVLAKEREELDKMKRHRDEVAEELRAAQAQTSLLQSQITEAEESLRTLERKFFSAVDLLQNYKREQEELQIERDNALKEAEDLRREQLEAASSSQGPQFFSEFSFSEIEEATMNFNPSLKIGEGGYGTIYKGVLHHTEVAIKMLHADSLQGPSEFQQEVDVLSKLRHPNLVTLIGACPEAWALVYEYLPNGSLEDRLCCKNNTQPLSWQTRIRIATELCSVLIFLHSSKPHIVVHGDLKPSNILLDENFISKLSDFGICRLISSQPAASSLQDSDTVFCRTDPKGTFAYMDPEFLSTGELTSKSDVYSFGIILLRLLTGKQALGIAKEVQYALDQGNLTTVLDPLAGDWPFVQAEQIARLGLRCCGSDRKNRADLGSDVWRVLEPMRASCGGSSSFRLGSGAHFQPPTYFICPIFQELMQDPHVAADGFTYEAEALRGWLDSGHDTSPMTNLKLEHVNLVPNRALRSAIQEWLQQH